VAFPKLTQNCPNGGDQAAGPPGAHPFSSASATSWTVSTWSLATSGSGAGEGCARGVVINEFTDPLGSGNFNYEFVELYYDN